MTGRIVAAILANTYLIAVPVLLFTDTLGNVSYLAGYGLAVGWAVALVIALCAGDSPDVRNNS